MQTRSWLLALFCTAVPTHHAAIFRNSASSLRKRATRGVQSPNGSMLFALSRLSISCSKLSKATSLLGSVMSGERMAAMDSFIRSASEGPPKRALRASALTGRLGAAEVASGSVVVEDSLVGWEAVMEVEIVGVELFSMDHLKRSFSLGSMMAVCGIRCCCGIEWSRDQSISQRLQCAMGRKRMG